MAEVESLEGARGAVQTDVAEGADSSEEGRGIAVAPSKVAPFATGAAEIFESSEEGRGAEVVISAANTSRHFTGSPLAAIGSEAGGKVKKLPCISRNMDSMDANEFVCSDI